MSLNFVINNLTVYNYLKGGKMMGRIRVTQLFPFLIPIRLKQRKYKFYKEMEKDDHLYSEYLHHELLEFVVFESEETMVNNNSGYDIKYQYNKVYNLKLAAKVLDKLIIAPGETFSFWKRLKEAQQEERFKNGLTLVNDKITEAPGGGLCQLSNILYWVFLHSPLSTVERTAHDVESFYLPDKLYGIDATVSEGWLDLKVKNNTDVSFQLDIQFTAETIKIRLMSSQNPTASYEIFNLNNEIFYKNGQPYRKVDIGRSVKDLITNDKNNVILYTDIVKIGYNLEGI